MSTIAKFLPKPPDQFSTQIASSTVGATDLTVTLDSTSGLPTEGVGQFFKKDANGDLVAGSVEFVHWTNVAGNTITFSDTDDRGITGSDSGAQAYVADDYFEVWASSYYVGGYGGLIAHDSAGVHLSGATYASPVFSGTATGTYTLAGTPTITSPTINTPTLTLANATTMTTDGGILYDRTNEKLLVGDGTNTQAIQTGAWTSWTPSWTNFTPGSATITAFYCQQGKTVHVRLSCGLAADSSVSGAISFSLPVNTKSTSQVHFPVHIADAGTADFIGSFMYTSASVVGLFALKSDGTYVSYLSTSSTVPMTWTTSDSFTTAFTYEAA